MKPTNLEQFVRWAKKFCVALSAALAILSVALVDGVVTPSEWVQIVIAALGAIGVYKVTNEKV